MTFTPQLHAEGVCVHACLCVCVCVCVCVSPIIPLPTSVFSLLFLHFALCSSSLHLSFSRCVCSAQDAHLKGAHTHTHTHRPLFMSFLKGKYKKEWLCFTGTNLTGWLWFQTHTYDSYWTVAINCVYVCERKSSISAYILYSVGFMFHLECKNLCVRGAMRGCVFSRSAGGRLSLLSEESGG